MAATPQKLLESTLLTKPGYSTLLVALCIGPFALLWYIFQLLQCLHLLEVPVQLEGRSLWDLALLPVLTCPYFAPLFSFIPYLLVRAVLPFLLAFILVQVFLLHVQPSYEL